MQKQQYVFNTFGILQLLPFGPKIETELFYIRQNHSEDTSTPPQLKGVEIKNNLKSIRRIGSNRYVALFNDK